MCLLQLVFTSKNNNQNRNSKCVYFFVFFRSLLTDLVKVCGAPDLLSLPLELTHRKAELLLQDVQTTLSNLPDIPEPKQDSFYPMEIFLQSELSLLGQLTRTVQSDVALLLKIARGQMPGTAIAQRLLKRISCQGIPLGWFSQSFKSCQTLSQWARGLVKRVEILKEYCEDAGDTPRVYNLAVFSRPDRFMQSLLQTYARKEFRDINTLTLQTQVNVMIYTIVMYV